MPSEYFTELTPRHSAIVLSASGAPFVDQIVLLGGNYRGQTFDTQIQVDSQEGEIKSKTNEEEYKL